MTSSTAPTVFIVDDDDLVRASIQGMLKSVGLHSETFGTAQAFLRGKRKRWSKLPRPGRKASRSQWSGSSARVGLRRHPNSHHLHHRSW